MDNETKTIQKLSNIISELYKINGSLIKEQKAVMERVTRMQVEVAKLKTERKKKYGS